jgi:hypothetical protein
MTAYVWIVPFWDLTALIVFCIAPALNGDKTGAPKNSGCGSRGSCRNGLSGPTNPGQARPELDTATSAIIRTSLPPDILHPWERKRID